MFDQGRSTLTVVVLSALVLGASAYAQPNDYVFEFSLDIGSDTELSDPFRDGDEGFDPADVYWWQSSPVDPPGRDGFKDDLFIFAVDPWPDPPDPGYATAAPVGAGGIEGYWDYLDLDGHDQLADDLYELAFIPPGWALDSPIPQWESPCIYGADYLMISYDDDMGPGWPAADVPVSATSPSGVSSYGTTSGQNEIVGLNLMTWGGPPPYPLLNVYAIGCEATVHQSLSPNPDNTEEQDDDIDSLDIVPPYGDCPVWYFSADHEGHFGLDPGGIYQLTSWGPMQIIDEFIHLGLPEDTDIDAFEFVWLEDPQQPGMLCFAVLFSVDEDDPLTPWDETGTLPPNIIFGSFLTGWSFQVLQEGLDDDIDALTGWYQPIEVAQPTGACCLEGCECELMTQTACIGLGGTWAGADIDCSDADGDGVADGCFTCVGDTNCDSNFDLADMAQVLANYGETTGMDFTDGDMDGDGDVDLADLGAVLARYGTTCWGACCAVDDRGGYECVANNTEGQCLAMGGHWYQGEDCFGDPAFDCPSMITIEILTDNYGSETTWELVERDSGTVVASGGPYDYYNPQLYTYDVEVDSTGCYDFIIYDSYGDGICCGYGYGYYNVYYRSALVCTGGEFEYEETCTNVTGGCPEITIEIFTDDYGSETTWELVERPSGTVVASGGPYDYSNPQLYTYVVEVDGSLCYDWIIYDDYGDGICCYEGDGYYNVYYKGALVCTGGEFGYFETCANITGDCDEITIEIMTDDNSGDTTWELIERGSGTVVASGAPLDDFTLHTWGVAVDGSLCYNWTIYDSAGDGICCEDGDGYYNVYYNGDLVCTGGEFEDEETCANVTGCVEITIEILTDDYGSETTWELLERPSGTVVASGGPYDYGNPQLYTYHVAVDGSLCYDWIIYDDYGNGICCDEGYGYYKVYYNDELVCEGGEFDYLETCANITGACDEITIEVMTDDNSGDTTWELIERASGTVVASGDPLHDFTLYTWGVAVDGSLCYDWTIYDSAGDGICCEDGWGWYRVYYAGELVCTGGVFEYEDSCEGMGGGCVWPEGACCVEHECVATNTEPECDDLGGSFHEGETCPEFECPEPDFLVEAPFTSELLSTCGAGDDCALRDTEEHEYEVIIPHAGLWNFNTCLHDDPNTALDTYIFLGTSLCSQNLGYNDNACGVAGLLSEIVVQLEAGNYFCTVEGYSGCGEYIFDVHEIPLGACCVDEVCEATNTQAECDDLGGIFFEGETCPEFECPCAYCTPCFTNCGATGEACPDPTSTPDDWITNVTFNTINNDTYSEGCPCSYGDYSDMSTIVEQEATYTLSVTFCSEGIWTQHVSAWFDWNQDCVFEESERYYLGSGIDATVTAEITVPATALQGPTGMRVIERWGDEPTDPCEQYSYGEAEDYTVIVGEYEPAYGACCDDFTGVCEDGVEQIDCDGRFAADTLCADLDPPCGILGACCIDYVCVATTVEADCAGSWYEGETCPEFACPAPDFLVEAPFTSEVLSTCGAGDDCALRGTEEHEYEVIIPHAGRWNFNTCLHSDLDTYIFLGTSLCSQDLGSNDDTDGCGDGLQSQIIVELEAGNYFCTVEGFSGCGDYIFDVHESTTITIEIMTDDYGSETTWELVERDSGTVVASGGPYDNNTLYTRDVEVDGSLCYDWTIYDVAGDGICCAYGDGYYNVYYNGELVCTGGVFGSEDSCEGMGDGCVWPEGACCVGSACVATNTEPECDDLGGSFFEGETCPEFACPETYADFLVEAPFTSELLSTCGAGDDCALRSTEEHEYEVIIPHAGRWSFNTCLHSDLNTYIFLGTALCTDDLGDNNNACGAWGSQSEIVVQLEAGNYFCTIEGSYACGEYIFDVHEIPLGACCVDSACVATNTEAECDDLGGTFFEGETCPEFQCPCVYCTPCFTNCAATGAACPDPNDTPDDWITNVTFNTIDNDTYSEGCPCSYGDYSDMSTTVGQGNAYTLSVTFCSEGDYIQHVSAWFDWNRNCVFEESERYYLGGGIDATLTAEITVPATALQGPTGMRVIERYDGAPNDPCEEYSYGEAEDYTVIVGEHQPTYGACCDDFSVICEDGVEQLDCDGRFAADTLCAELDPPCGTLGACCVDWVCVATNPEAGCDAMGGDWYIDETCPEFECPLADFVVEAPYTSPLRDACGSDDCPLREYDEHTYYVTIPYASVWNFNTCLDDDWDTYIFLGTSWCSQDIGSNDDSDDCGDGLQSEIVVQLEAGNYFCTIEGYSDCDIYIFDVHESTGACCVDEVCVATTTKSECDVLGGTFYLGVSCDTFQCPAPCPESQIDIVILTDYLPSETTWEVTDFDTGQVLCSGGPYYEENTYYHEQCCIGYADCANFTIYDSYGDGIDEAGGYAVSVDGELICDAMGGSFTGSSATCEMLGGGCVWPEGACCVEHVCAATNTEPECDDLGGSFHEGETCPEFVCPLTDADFLVEAPFTSEVLSTCGAGDDCALRDMEEHEYEVIIPHAGLWNFNTCLHSDLDTYIFLGTSLCSQDLGYNDDTDGCGGSGLQSEIIVNLEAGNYFCTVEGWYGCGEYIFDVYEEAP